MLQVRETPVTDHRLTPYVAGYGLIRLRSDSIHEKELLPWPGGFLLFVNQAFELEGQTYPSGCLRGIHESASCLRWQGDELEVFAVRFAPCGLRPFLSEPLERLTNSVSAAPELWNSPSPSVYRAVAAAPVLETKVTMVEDFLIGTLNGGGIDAIDRTIMELADTLQHDPSATVGPARERIPLGNRQFARRFKALTGVTLRTYLRICRFAYAKTSLLRSSTPSLTALGYDAGYFDQAHFSRDFTHLAEQSPKRFPAHYPLHRLLAERDD
ncbi:helix-turn-helix domain-containing protein [Lewinella sp. IMCC34183]|uniref:helix-turn-helix domain-containing protein n=1 Tax=Lewinella sp. IMCC34183 TaxID=2248762 RepID=UPI000E238225|nr:helix-turn-helix domain-containing protein [Lewinella sp. IMCC34183]